MAAHVHVDPAAVKQAISALRREGERLHFESGCRGMSPLGTFTAVAGLREVGQRLGHISGFYAPEALGVYAKHLFDAAEISEVNLENTMLADDTFAHALTRVGASGGAGAVAAGFRSNTGAANAKASRFTPPTPVPGFEPNLLMLHHKLMATRVPAASKDALQWHGVASKAASASEALFQAKSALASSMDTQWVRRGDRRLNQMQRAGMVFATRAGAMAGHTQALGAVASAEQVMASVAVASFQLLPLPARAAFEQAYLAAFGPRLAASLAATVPTFNQLMPDLAGISGDTFRIGEITQPAAPEFTRSPLPEVVREAFAAGGHADLARAATPAEVVSQYGQPNPDVLEAIATGATATQAAAVAAPSMPPTLSPGVGGVGGASTPGAGVTPSGVAPVGAIGSLTGGAAGVITRTAAAGVAGTAPALGVAMRADAAAGGASVGGAAAGSATARGVAGALVGAGLSSSAVASALTASAGLSGLGAHGTGIPGTTRAGARHAMGGDRTASGVGAPTNYQARRTTLGAPGAGKEGKTESLGARKTGANEFQPAASRALGGAGAAPHGVGAQDGPHFGAPNRNAAALGGANVQAVQGGQGGPGGQGQPGAQLVQGAGNGTSGRHAVLNDRPVMPATTAARAGGIGVDDAFAHGAMPGGFAGGSRAKLAGQPAGPAAGGGLGAGGLGAGGLSTGGLNTGGLGAGLGANIPGANGALPVQAGGLGGIPRQGAGSQVGLGGVPASSQGVSGSGGGQPRTPIVGGAPMGVGAGGQAGAGKKVSKVKAVTSAVEREGNLQALLGEATLVVPAVIGAQTRG